MIKHTLLVEIGTEELPSKELRRFGESFAQNIEYEFHIINTVFEKIVWFASSRRLAVQVVNVVFSSSMDIGYVSETMAPFSEHENLFDKSFLCKENSITSLLSNIINNALMALPISMMMRWGKDNTKFIRPVRTVSVLLDDKVVLCSFLGIESNRVIRGHRLMGDKKIVLDYAENYKEILLRKGFVIVDYEQRKSVICCGIENIAKSIGGVVDCTGNLLEEVTALSEWPVVLFGSFDKSFLYIPIEILLHIMKFQKKYFPVYDLRGKLLPYFIFVIDIITESNKRIITCHEKVLNVSFSDAQFFLNCDGKYLLEDYIFHLNTVFFHKKLGTLYDKSIRIKNLSSWLASEIGINIYHVERAAMLSKCDLLSHVVSEFPFSQGIIGMYYALRDGESSEVALALKEQYQPRFSSDVLPSGFVSCVISIVDKVDTISGMFIIGEYPKGSRDPMGLRRAAIGVLRIIIEKKIAVDLWSLVEKSLNLYDGFLSDGLTRKIINFMYKRLCVLYGKKGYKIGIVRATVSDKLSNLSNFDDRIKAVSSFCLLEESRLLFFMYKRIFNILQDVSRLFEHEVNRSLLIEKEEISLSKKILIFYQEIDLLCQVGRYYDALKLLVSLHTFLDNFFKNVVVMAEEDDLRLNRLVLLSKVWYLLLPIINTPRHIIFETLSDK